MGGTTQGQKANTWAGSHAPEEEAGGRVRFTNNSPTICLMSPLLFVPSEAPRGLLSPFRLFTAHLVVYWERGHSSDTDGLCSLTPVRVTSKGASTPVAEEMGMGRAWGGRSQRQVAAGDSAGGESLSATV